MRSKCDHRRWPTRSTRTVLLATICSSNPLIDDPDVAHEASISACFVSQAAFAHAFLERASPAGRVGGHRLPAGALPTYTEPPEALFPAFE